METIKLNEIKPGYCLFLEGTSKLAKGIQWFQKLKYGKNSFYYMNHVGIFDKFVDGKLLVYEEAMPGKFRSDSFYFEYEEHNSIVYVGIPKFEMSNFSNCREEMQKTASTEKLFDYSFKSYISFIANAVGYKLIKKDLWITGVPNGATCSQRTALLYQKFFGVLTEKEYYKYFPCEIAQSGYFDLKKLEY
jgi:hypothetical protein